MYFQDTNGNLHFLSDDDIARGGMSLLPKGCTQITDESAATIQAQQVAVDAANAPPPDPLSDLIVALINNGTLTTLPASISAMPAVQIAVNNLAGKSQTGG